MCICKRHSNLSQLFSILESRHTSDVLVSNEYMCHGKMLLLHDVATFCFIPRLKALSRLYKMC